MRVCIYETGKFRTEIRVWTTFIVHSWISDLYYWELHLWYHYTKQWINWHRHGTHSWPWRCPKQWRCCHDIPPWQFAPSTQASEPADNTYNTILNVTQKKRKKEKLKKTYIVPKRLISCTKSLLQSRQRVNQQRSSSTALQDTPNGLRNIIQRPHPHSSDLGRCGRSRTAHHHHTRPRLVWTRLSRSSNQKGAIAGFSEQGSCIFGLQPCTDWVSISRDVD